VNPAARDEDCRRQALARYAVLDTPPDRGFDEIAELARSLTGSAAAAIGFLDQDRVWFKSAVGFDLQACPRQAFPADRVVGGPQPVADAQPAGGTGDRVITVHRPFTLAGEQYTFCAAAPIVTGEGYLLGELLVLDRETGDLTQAQRAGLVVLARQVQRGLELRRTLLSYHAVVDGVGHVVFQTDEWHRLVSVTPTWSRLTGYGVIRSLSQPLLDYVHGGDREQVAQQLAGLDRAHSARTFECRLLRLLGGDVAVEVIARPLIDEGGQRRGLVGVIADITERRARAVEAEHAQKLEALGRLSAGLAHEINTPIQFVSDNTHFLSDSYEALLTLVATYRSVLTGHCLDGQPNHGGAGHTVRREEIIRQAEAQADIDYISQEIPEAIEQSLDGLARVSTLVRAMRVFSHAGDDLQAPADLNEALRAAVTIAESQIKAVADIECELADLPPVVCSIGDLNQVFLNLLINAVDAITDTGVRGTITLGTRVEGDEAVVTFTDTGPGIPEELRLRIFEPFFTTKPVGRGTGQGLALARAVVHDRHGGRITVTSQPGQGSTFTVRLPVAGRRTGSEGAPARSDDHQSST
jgi:PAS domain S-box-containing protein